MDDLQLLTERANDSLVQSRCDRRSLAVLAKVLFEKGYIISSTSQLIRSIIEELRTRCLNEGAEDILSYEDADRILQQFSIKGLNTNKRQMSIYMRQQGKEALFLDGQPVDYAALSPRVTKKILASKDEQIHRAAQKMLESGEALEIFKTATTPREFRPNPDAVSSDEPATAKAERWHTEQQETKKALATPPTSIIQEDTTNGKENKESTD